MRVLFICGSLESGKDGVGDYTRQLACEMIRQGHMISALSINDHFVNTTRSEIQIGGNGININVMRFPSINSFKEQFEIVHKWISNLDPQWISLQFVPFSFHEKGLFFGLGKYLSCLGKGRCWHIMFHELWVGMDKESSVKYRIWGLIQKKLIQSLLSEIKPTFIHTQTKLYQLQLTMLNYNSIILPLFSNIPTLGKSEKDLQVSNKIIFIIFGHIHPGAPVQEFTKEVSHYSRKNEVSVSLRIVGRCGNEQERWISMWQSEGLKVEVLGEQPLERISEALSEATIGISTTPSFLAEKSGTVAAMREHGLPVLCVSRVWNPRGISNLKLPPFVFNYQSGNFDSCITSKQPERSRLGVEEISRQMTENLLRIN